MGASHTAKSKNTTMDCKNSGKDGARRGNASSERPLSIEGPLGQHNHRELLPNQPRQPTNLQDVLRYSIEARSTMDAPQYSTQPIDEERKKFLNDAITAMSVNVVEELQKDIKFLKNVSEIGIEDDPSEYEAALERICDYVDNTDVANDFYKLGGFSVFGICLNSPHSSIRWKVADIIAELTQNNPFCQERVLEAGFMPILLSMVDTDPSDQARIKALYAVSCIVRGHAMSLRYMEINDGYSILLRAIQSSVEKLQIKSAFLLSALCNRDNADNLKATLVKMGLIEQAAGLLAMGSLLPETREQLLGMVNGLTNDFLPALEECRRPELCLKQTLERQMQEAKKEQSPEREALCKEIVNKVFADDDNDQER